MHFSAYFKMNLAKAAIHPLSRCMSLTHLGSARLRATSTLCEFASIPRSDVMKLKNFLNFTLNVHLDGLSLRSYSNKVENISQRTSRLESPRLDFTTMLST